MSLLEFPLIKIWYHPLGDRASPEGLESTLAEQKPIYGVIKGEAYQMDKLQDFNARPRLFISKHTNIDDLLGKLCVLWV